MDIDLPLPQLLLLVGAAIGVNVIALVAARTAEPRESWLLAVMALDVLIFSGLLYFTGGPLNPFSFLYLVSIALAAITLRAAATWALVWLSLVCSAVLFAAHFALTVSGAH